MKEVRETLSAIAATVTSDVNESISVAWPRQVNAAEALAWLRGYLRENEGSVVRLYVYRARPQAPSPSALVTYHSMASAMQSPLIAELLAGFGDSGYGSLPGQPRFRAKKYKCPKCDREVISIPLDGVSPPKCSNGHPPTHMRPE